MILKNKVYDKNGLPLKIYSQEPATMYCQIMLVSVYRIYCSYIHVKSGVVCPQGDV